MLCAIAFFFSIIVYRLAAKAALSRNENEGIASSASLLASLSASVIDIVAIVALDKVSVHYNACAVFLSIHVLVLFWCVVLYYTCVHICFGCSTWYLFIYLLLLGTKRCTSLPLTIYTCVSTFQAGFISQCWQTVPFWVVFFVFPFLPALFWGNITPFTDMPWMDIPNRSTERLPSG